MFRGLTWAEWKDSLRQRWHDYRHFQKLKKRFYALQIEWKSAEFVKRCKRCMGRRILISRPGTDLTYHQENHLGHFCTRCGRGYKQNLFQLLDTLEEEVIVLTLDERVQPAESD
ncbi:MAG: hypothetical protein WC787_04440 [Patescibacteria group bacterium]|jgi:hypothetical protein